MTDIHGSDPDNREDSLRDADVQDSITEVPSEYEFADGLNPDEGAEGKPARRSAFLPIVAALGGVVILGGVAWWQLGGNAGALLGAAGSSMPLPSAMTAYTPPATSAAAPLTPTTPKTAATASVENNAEKTSSIASSSALPNEPIAPSLQVKPEEAPVQAAPVAPAISTPLPPPTALAVPAPMAAVVSAPAETNKADPRVDALNAKVEELQKALDQANQQLKTAISPETAAANEALLQDRINKLEQQIASLQKTGDAGAESSPSLQTETPKIALAKPKVVARKAPAPNKSVAKKTAQPEKSSSWVLRSASPGTAWISKTADSLELREVHIGDKLPGVGRVTAIESQDDSWIVRGTTGSVH